MAAIVLAVAAASGCEDPRGPSVDSPATLRWRFSSEAACRLKPPASDGRLVYVPFSDGYVRAFDISTGDIQWRSLVGGSTHDDIRLFAGRLFVQMDFGTTALDPSTGTRLWVRSDTSDYTWGVLSYDSLSSILVSGDNRRSVWGLRATDGSVAWRVDVGEVTHSTLSVERTVYAGTANMSAPAGREEGHIVAIDLDSRRIVWSFLAPRLNSSSGFLSPLSAASGVVLGTSGNGRVYAVNAATGQEIWQFDGTVWFGGSVTDGHRVFVPSMNGHLYALDLPSGRELWSAFFGGGSLYTEPTLFGDRLVLVKVGPTLYALDKTTGRTEWTYSLRFNNICSTPLAVGDKIVLDAEDGIYVLQVSR